MLTNETMNIHEKFGLAVATLRKERGYSQERFALEANIARKYMSDIENGKRNVSLDVIKRIADKFGISVSDLFLKVEEIDK